jgi:hypothetical protein
MEELLLLSSAKVPKVFVYGLVDPRTEQVRYVGRSSSGIRRPRRHTAPSELRGKSHKKNWLRQLLAEGFQPRVVVIESLGSPEELSARERYWIRWFRDAGAPLTNTTAGGEGSLGAKPSIETRQKMSEALKRRDPEVRRQAALKIFGRKRSAESRAQMRLGQKRRREAPDYVPPRLGREFPSATLRRLSELKGGRSFVEKTTGQSFDTLGSAAKALGVTPSRVSDVLHGRYAATKGFVFEFKE